MPVSIFSLKFNTFSLDKVILKILDKAEGAVCLNTLSFILPVSKVKIAQRLKKLSKNGKIRKATEKRTSFWRPKQKNENDSSWTEEGEEIR